MSLETQIAISLRLRQLWGRCSAAALIVAVLAATFAAPAGIAAPSAPPSAPAMGAPPRALAPSAPAPAQAPGGPPPARASGAAPPARAAGAAVAGAVPQDPWPGASGPAPGPVAEPRVLARAAVLADESTGQVLFERAARQPRAMASTTKVMTALLALERLDPRRVVVIGAGPPRVGEESLRLRRFVTTNQLLGAYRWTVGGKTGYTNLAGRCLVASASRGGRRLVAVALGSPDAFADVRALFEYGFSRFVRVRLAAEGQAVSLGPARPAALRVEADVDAMVRLDQLGGVSLAATAADGATGGATSAWFVAGRRRLVPVRLGRLPADGRARAGREAP